MDGFVCFSEFTVTALDLIYCDHI